MRRLLPRRCVRPGRPQDSSRYSTSTRRESARARQLHPANKLARKKLRRQMKLIGACLIVCGVLSAQGPQKQDENAARMAAGSPPIYRISVTARTAKAISYQHRSGSTKVDFRGTDLLPNARGLAKVESKQGRIEIEAEFEGLQTATKNGAEYLTYVLWAVTPEGRTANLGEVLLNGSKSKMTVTTELQVFGLVVTAEPYFAVTQPSDLIVMENVARKDTVGKIEEIDAKYELLQRGQYQHLANLLALKADRRLPLELYEARNAVQIARAMGADRFAAETFQKAEKSLGEAEAYQKRNAGRKPVSMTAREAVQTAEDSRAIAVKRQEADVLTAERQGLVDREARAVNGQVAAQSETDRITREAEAARIKAQAEAERVTRENNAQATAASAEPDNAAKQKAQLEADKVELRVQLLKQFNVILQTRDTARGLIVNMSDVLFDTAKFTLRPVAREKLAKVAGIVSAHPGLRLDVEGHTDSVGGDDYNQQLSEQRGAAVRDYLLQQGMPVNSVTSKGFGKTQPVATNDTAAGRQTNRRVEIVISGEVIGTEIGKVVTIRSCS